MTAALIKKSTKRLTIARQICERGCLLEASRHSAALLGLEHVQADQMGHELQFDVMSTADAADVCKGIFG
jgi:hypothetical protein